MKRIIFIAITTLLLIFMVGCTEVNKVEDEIDVDVINEMDEIDVVSMAEPSAEDVKLIIDGETEEVNWVGIEPVIEEVVEKEVAEEEVVEEEVVEEEVVEEVVEVIEEEIKNETYVFIGPGIFFSEPFTEIYPTVTDKGIEIRNGNSEKTYVVIAVKEEVEDYMDLSAVEQEGLRFDLHNGSVELTEDEMNLLYENMIFYLYEMD